MTPGVAWRWCVGLGHSGRLLPDEQMPGDDGDGDVDARDRHQQFDIDVVRGQFAQFGINVFYNRKRQHSTLGHTPPVQFLENWIRQQQSCRG